MYITLRGDGHLANFSFCSLGRERAHKHKWGEISIIHQLHYRGHKNYRWRIPESSKGAYEGKKLKSIEARVPTRMSELGELLAPKARSCDCRRQEVPHN